MIESVLNPTKSLFLSDASARELNSQPSQSLHIYSVRVFNLKVKIGFILGVSKSYLFKDSECCIGI